MATFGRVYGTIICFSGLVNLFQPAIDAMNHTTFADNPIPINVVLAILGFVFGTILVVFVHVQGKRAQKKRLAEEAALDRQRRIPESIMESEMESEYEF